MQLERCPSYGTSIPPTQSQDGQIAVLLVDLGPIEGIGSLGFGE